MLCKCGPQVKIFKISERFSWRRPTTAKVTRTIRDFEELRQRDNGDGGGSGGGTSAGLLRGRISGAVTLPLLDVQSENYKVASERHRRSSRESVPWRVEGVSKVPDVPYDDTIVDLT